MRRERESVGSVMPASSRIVTTVELALQSLQDERTECVRRLEATLAARGAETEIQGWLQRIADINATLVRLAGGRPEARAGL